MTIALCMVGDGRLEYLARAIESLRAQVDYPFAARIMVNDSGDRAVHHYLRKTYPEFRLISHGRRKGTVAAVRSAWTAALRTRADYVFHTEEDFTYNEPVDLEAMQELLESHRELAQVVLKRDPYSWPEQEAGGFMELRPYEYKDRESPAGPWVAHERLFSSNPSLVPRRILQLGFNGEARFGTRCRANGYTFAYWGRTIDPPRVTHIGQVRSVGWRD